MFFCEDRSGINRGPFANEKMRIGPLRKAPQEGSMKNLEGGAGATETDDDSGTTSHSVAVVRNKHIANLGGEEKEEERGGRLLSLDNDLAKFVSPPAPRASPFFFFHVYKDSHTDKRWRVLSKN